MFNCRSRVFSGFTGLGQVPYVWGATVTVLALQALAVYLPPLARVLGTTPPNPSDWLVTVISFAIPIAVVEVVKAIGRARGATSPDANTSGIRKVQGG